MEKVVQTPVQNLQAPQSMGGFIKPQVKVKPIVIVLAVVVILGGVVTGWVLAGGRGSSSSVAPGATMGASEAGFEEKGDTAEGKLEEGGIDGEGNFRLVREGGPSKIISLTSTVIDLKSFVGKKVKIWGETLAAKKSPWLMDVTKIKVIE